MPEKVKTMFNEDINDYELTNKIKYFSATKSLYQPITISGDFECMIKNSNEKLKLEELTKNKKYESYIVKTVGHVSNGFLISTCYLPDVKCKKNEYFCFMGDDCLDLYVRSMNKILSDSVYFSRKKQVEIKDKDKKLQKIKKEGLLV